MTNTQSELIKNNITALSQEMDFDADWGREDGYTWLSIAGENVTPDKYKEFSQAIADACGVNFYFNKISCGDMAGAVDWNFNEEQSYSSEPGCDIDDYGTLFAPTQTIEAKPRSGMR